MMITLEEDFQDRNNLSLEDIDLSLLRLSSPPYAHSSFFSSLSPEIISPLKRSSPLSDESDHFKRRKISFQNPFLITSPNPETQDPNLAVGQINLSNASPVSKKQETTPPAPKNPDTEKQQEEEEEEKEEEEEEEEEECGEGMRIERSGDGFVIRLKCRCKQAFRVVFSDEHLYFKLL